MSKTASLPQIRVEPETKLELECLAEQDGRTLSDYVRRVLEQHLQCLRELTGEPVLSENHPHGL